MKDSHTPELEEDYYFDNFHAIVSFVMDTYRDLLTPDEQQWFETICRTSRSAQCLYIRLLTRRGSTFRLGRLHYAEIPAIDHAAMELVSCGLASAQPPQAWSALLACFTKPELLDRLGLHQLRNQSRVELTTHISSVDHVLQKQYKQSLQVSEQWMTLDGHAYWMLMQLCYFGNLYQDSRELVLSQLGTLTYEDYPLDAGARAFVSRQQIDAHWRYFECEALYDTLDSSNANELIKLADSLPQHCANDASLRRRLDRIRNRIARQLERLSHADDALRLYSMSEHPPARERRVRLMMAAQQWEAARALAQQMSDAPYNEPEKLCGLKLNGQCRRALGIAHAPQRVFKPASSKLVLHNDGSRVEELARRFYANQGQCFHTENTLVNGVLGLYIWDIVFHPVPGVFFNPYQQAPADFNQPEFYASRASLFERRFAELDHSDNLNCRVHKAYKQHFGKLNPLVRWQRLSHEMLSLAIDRIPLNHWRVLFERILQDTRENTAGFPDLILFPECGGYEFIEIKGPGDTLQSNQRRWMQYFDRHAVNCRLVHVRYRRES